ncbi:MAG: non-canonical purine NTP pyrophosphatase, RdgB/HAM1 family [Candidatus Alkanophagales archaeon]|nr:MAG: non-canonical purine NTP pyrophosphatase, RdgB/HAM1 family [Candidatus Alkanophagales archaeon]
MTSDEMEITIVTGNKGKLREFRELAEELSGGLLRVKQADMPKEEIQADRLEEIALHAARVISKLLEPPFFVEDSGLFIEALNGFPGPYSAYVHKKIGNEGILKLMSGVENRRATFKCVIAFISAPSTQPKLFVGSVSGRIAESIRGDKGFGYDPIFEFSGRTFAELDTKEKNKVSHRGQAFKKLLQHLGLNYGGEHGIRNASSLP